MRPPVPLLKGAKCSPRDSALDRKFIRDTCQTKNAGKSSCLAFQHRSGEVEPRRVKKPRNDSFDQTKMTIWVWAATAQMCYLIPAEKNMNWRRCWSEYWTGLSHKVLSWGVFQVFEKFFFLVKSLNQCEIKLNGGCVSNVTLI